MIAQEHEIEPIPGLPGDLPKGEALVWQGSPNGRSLALRALHVRKIAIYCALISAWNLGLALAEGASLVSPLLWSLGLSAGLIAMLAGFAWASARSTLYSITTKRVVIRSGVALPITVNLPLAKVEAAALKVHGDGTGDIPLKLTEDERVSYLILWPSVRPWRLKAPEPMLRAIPEPEFVAGKLTSALKQRSAELGTQVIAGPLATGETSRPPGLAAGSASPKRGVNPTRPATA